MSAGLPYLRGLRKSDLSVLADLSNLKDYGELKKSDLETALDNHLSANQSALSKEPKLTAYYRRLSRASPVKKEPKAETSSVLSEETKKPARPKRATATAKKEEVEATDESDASSQRSKSPPTTTTRTPARRSGLSFPSLPPSPAVVTEAIDRQTTRVRKSFSEAWDASGASDHSSALRSRLSSVSAIQTLIAIFEISCLANELFPLRYLSTFPAVPSLRSPAVAVKVPDLFVLLSASFWAPFSIWLTTSVVLPLTVAYFFNLDLRAAGGASHTYGTRRAATSASRKVIFDPLVFYVAKGLVSYLVYGNQFTFWNAFSRPAIRRVAGAVPGGLRGLLTGSAVCTLGSLYEAILRR